MEEDTEFRLRLDIGRMLILASIGKSLSKEITVKVEDMSILVKMVEQEEPVSSEWVSNHLRIRYRGSNLNCVSEEEELI